MRGRESWAVSPVNKRKVNRELGVNRAIEHNKEGTVMDTDGEVKGVDNDGIVTVVVGHQGTIAEHMLFMDKVRDRLDEARSHQQVAAAVWRGRI